MNTTPKSLLSLFAVALLLSSPLMAGPGGHGGGGGGWSGGGGGWSGGGSGWNGGGGGWNGGRSGSGGRNDGGGGGHWGDQGGVRGYSNRSPAYTAPRSNGPGGHPGGHYDGHFDGHSSGRPDSYHGGHDGGHLGGPASFSHSYHPYHPYYGHWYHGDWHDHWIRPWYCGPVAWVSVGFVAGAVVWDAPWYWGYWSYYNPYCTDVIVVDHVVIDYSRPIVLATPPGGVAVVNPSAVDSETSQLLEGARSAFARADYPAATTLVDKAIAKTPNDPVLHEFRGLILFATGQYRAAAAAIYAVLSVGPGWDWSTLSGFYPNPDVYAGQLRALERYRNEHSDSPEVHFLLAYHYMSGGNNEAAATELKEVVRLNAKDQLAAQLLAGLSTDKPAASPAVTPPAVPAPPVSAANLVGSWEASRPDGASFAFSLTSDSTYSWQYLQQGKSQQFTGTYTVADNLLILKRDGNPTMIGQITLVDGDRFNFKLVGTNPNDPGITFSKKK